VRTREKFFLQMRICALFGAKKFRFLRFMVCLHVKGREGIEPVRGKGSIFRNFVRMSLMDGTLLVFYYNILIMIKLYSYYGLLILCLKKLLMRVISMTGFVISVFFFFFLNNNRITVHSFVRVIVSSHRRSFFRSSAIDFAKIYPKHLQ